MSNYQIGEMAQRGAVCIYDLDPALTAADVPMPDPSTEPMSPAERRYFARVGDYYLERRHDVHAELRQAWKALKDEFLDDRALGRAEPPRTHLPMGELEALALMLRVISCRFGHPVWDGYCAALYIALSGHLTGEARKLGLSDPENAASDYLDKLLLRSLDPKQLPLPSDPEKRAEIIKDSTPVFWRFNPRSYFLRWFKEIAHNGLIDARRKRGSGIGFFAPYDPERHSETQDDGDVEGAALFNVTFDPALAKHLGALAAPLNGMGLDPAILKERIGAVTDAQREAETQMTLPGEIALSRAEARAKVIALEEMAGIWDNDQQIIDRTNARILSEGMNHKFSRYTEQKLYWRCVDEFVLRCMEAHGADPALADFYVVNQRPNDKNRSMESDIRKRMARFLKEANP